MVIRGKGVKITSGVVNISDTTAFITTSSGVRLSSVRTSAWGDSISHMFDITFPDSVAYNDFFQSGGQIRMSGDRTGGDTNNQNSSWTTLLQNTGTVIFDYNGTSNTGSIGVGSGFEYSSIPSGSFQTIFVSNSSAAYTGDTYTIQAQRLTSSVIRFNIIFDDAVDNSIDEIVTGTIRSFVDDRKFVSSVQPIYTTVTSLTAGS